jgi:methionyl-tRNA synthetase
VRFQTGTDDNALSNVISARERGIPVQVLVEKNSQAFRNLAEALHITCDQFVRTSQPAHHIAVTHFLASLKSEDTYVAPYRGLYCSRCEDFYLSRDAREGRCPEHAIELEQVDEVNHFFRLSRYQGAILDLIATRHLQIVPESRRVEVLRFVESGLKDFSISRGASRAGGWGVAFPTDPTQVVYVWVDALVNYLSGLGYPDAPDFDAFWSAAERRIHVIGKNVWKFHAVYWPALLLSAGHKLPDTVFAHGFLTEEGRKISKSSGGAEDPTQYVATYGTDAVRYYLLAYTRPYDDTDFSTLHLDRVYQSDLANTLGNLCSRLTALCETAGVSGVQLGDDTGPPGQYHEHLQRFRFDLAASELWNEFSRLNREIADERPWEGLKRPDRSQVIGRLVDWVSQLFSLARWLEPFLPSAAEQILAALSAPQVRQISPLFPKGRSAKAP